MNKSKSIEDITAILEDQRQSGHTQKDFCEERGFKYSTFQAWKNRLRKKSREISDPGFVKVAALPPVNFHQGVSLYRIDLKSGSLNVGA